MPGKNGSVPPPSRLPPRARQILWFIALWLAGVAVVGTLAYAIRAVLL